MTPPDDIDAASTDPGDSSPDELYRRVLEILHGAGIPYLVGGAYALAHHTRTPYLTRDLDVFLRRHDVDRACAALTAGGYRAGVVYSQFLAKAYDDHHFVDLIFGSGNGVVSVDDAWFAHPPQGELLGVPVRYCAVEDIVWSKAFIMERERFDGADIAHLLLAAGARLDWRGLLARFGPYWRVLLAHVVLFGFTYPGARGVVPPDVLDTLVGRLMTEPASPDELNLCRGGLLSRRQYLMDLNELGMRDARLKPDGTMTREEIDAWSEAGEE
jgi:hypothetical protein